eukprot:CAMPEP_0119106844 /NCGR_PEP_ID=MMETSP1180-20130426/6391_1 /TAXON_ID=3052 ORGANISM="Chlamydomonas cf sp, Strain CCMP681" /NCGR_SAMPLE_ID=MMETSP1180 /ASSEMBLY_ACC=CAM_ASM_000741 /LENGTH=40 /DNA_ID= /DNA_START= /DNA_END= /DNA_ORIENTATION=
MQPHQSLFSCFGGPGSGSKPKPPVMPDMVMEPAEEPEQAE